MRIFRYILPALALLAFACKPVENIDTPVFSVESETIAIDALGGQENITLSSDKDWSASSSQSWAKVMAVTGKGSKDKIRIPVSISENVSETPRTAVITIKNMAFETLTVTVSQEGNNGSIVVERGIRTADDMKAFASAINEGGSISKFMVNGTVVLLNDIDMSSVKDWTPIGTASSPFTGNFNAKGFKITGLDWTADLSKIQDFALFGVASNARIDNVVLGKSGDRISIKGESTTDKAYTVAGICGRAVDGTVLTNCVNNVEIVSSKLSNASSGENSVQVGGICGFLGCTTMAPQLVSCVNGGHISAPAGRGAGVVATVQKGDVKNCVNKGLVEDDLVGQFGGNSPQSKIMGGIAGVTAGPVTLSSCSNEGNVISRIGCLCGGFVGHSDGTVKSCTNTGCIISAKSESCGPAWGCGYNPAVANFTKNSGYGRVGDETFITKPQDAPGATLTNAVYTPATGTIDTEAITVDWTLDDYFAWTVDETKQLCDGCTYTRYICTGVPRRVCVLELDLNSASFDITTAFSDDIVPNPNANGNNNNGPKVRETLSQICARKRGEGQNILAGINTGFFDSNDGIGRAPHIEEGEPVYVNNPSVRQGLPNHDWAFTVFTDRTAACGKKSFSGSTYGPAGKFRIGGQEFDYSSVNDTIVRHVNTRFPANMYTYRYVKTPHPAELPSTRNALAKNAYYLVCEYTGDIMKVNSGYAQAKVTAIHDGRSSALAEGPYVTGKKQFVLALSGAVANTVSTLAGVGSDIEVRCDIAIDGQSKPIYTQNGTMFQFMVNGKDNSQSAPATHTNITTFDPVTYSAVSQDGRKVWLIEVDGRQAWFSMGLKSYEMYRIAQKLGAWNMTRFDGGGSACMWVYDQSASKGGLVSRPSDSKGERSCMNYILIRKK